MHSGKKERSRAAERGRRLQFALREMCLIEVFWEFRNEDESSYLSL